MNAMAIHFDEAREAGGLVAMPGLPMQARGLRKAYGRDVVLDDVSLDLAPGTVLGLIGRNGAGKTTLIRAMLGLIRVDAGSATIWDRPALKLDDAAKARIGYVPQQPGGADGLKVGDMLDFVGQHYPSWDAGFVHDTLARWRLPVDRMIGKLSPGERQRVAIIRALAPRPELLVLDEPAAALDPVARRDLLREIALRAGDSGTTVLFSTHIVSDLERVASHVAFLHGGRMLLASELDALKERHLRAHVPAALLARHPGALPGEVARRMQADGAAVLTVVREEGASWPELLQAEGVRREHLALEDLFIEVAG